MHHNWQTENYTTFLVDDNVDENVAMVTISDSLSIRQTTYTMWALHRPENFQTGPDWPLLLRPGSFCI